MTDAVDPSGSNGCAMQSTCLRFPRCTCCVIANPGKDSRENYCSRWYCGLMRKITKIPVNTNGLSGSRPVNLPNAKRHPGRRRNQNTCNDFLSAQRNESLTLQCPIALTSFDCSISRKRYSAVLLVV